MLLEDCMFLMGIVLELCKNLFGDGSMFGTGSHPVGKKNYPLLLLFADIFTDNTKKSIIYSEDTMHE